MYSHIRNSILAIVLLLCPFILRAQQRNMENAMKSARQHWGGINHDSPVADNMSFVERQSCYVASRRTTDNGRCKGAFVLISKDKRLPVVLAWSDESPFPETSLPGNVEKWIEDYSEMQNAYDEYPEYVDNWLSASKANLSPIEPLLKGTQWGQDAPYNLLCPKVDGKSCPSGCIATALAQIMRCHNWPIVGSGNIQYTTETHKIPVSYSFFKTLFKWDELKDRYDSTDISTDYSPISTLMKAVGAAVQMDYSPTGSGSNDPNALLGLKKYLGYDKDMFFAYPEDYFDFQWHKLLQTELAEGHPVYYTGEGAGGGHAFVIDGLQTDNISGLVYYHVNWGWDGWCNGYYLLNMLRPSSVGTGGTSGTNYGLHPSMLIGMKPDDGVEHPHMFCKSIDIRNDELYAGQLMSARVSRLVLRSDSDYCGDMSIVMTPLDKVNPSQIVLYEEPKRTITVKKGLTNYYITVPVPATASPGKYELKIQCVGENGNPMSIEGAGWPLIEIFEESDWAGGEQTQPMQKIAIGRNWHIDTTMSDSGYATIHIDSIINPLPVTALGTVSLLLCDENGKVISPFKDNQTLIVSPYSVRKDICLSLPLSNKIPNGDYTLSIGFLPNGESLWNILYQMNYVDNILWAAYTPFSVPLKVEDGLITINEFSAFVGVDMPWSSGITGEMRCNSLNHLMFDLTGRSAVSTFRKGILIIKKNGKSIKTIR